MELGSRVLYNTLMSKHAFRENRLDDSHTVLTNLSEFLPVSSTPGRPSCVKFDVDILVNPLTSSVCRENRYSELCSLVRGVNKLLLYLTHLSSSLVNIRYWTCTQRFEFLLGS
jgi:hypothetical protein